MIKSSNNGLYSLVILIICSVIAVITGGIIYSYQWDLTPEIRDEVDANKEIKAILLTEGRLGGDPWTNAHITSFLDASDQLGVVATVLEDVSSNDACMDAIEDFVSEGGDIVISTSAVFSYCINKAVAQFPNTKFLSVIDSVIKPASNLSTFSARMYLIRYLTGILAAYASNTTDFAFVASTDSPDVIRGINAYALGIRKIKPTAVVHVAIVGKEKDYAREAYLAEKLYEEYPSIDVYAYHLNSEEINKFCEKNSISCIGFHKSYMDKYPRTTLVSLEWNWTGYYKNILAKMQKGVFDNGTNWLDIKSGSAFLGKINNNLVNFDAMNMVDKELNDILFHDAKNVFIGPIFDNEHNLRVLGGRYITDEELLYRVNWFVDGVEVYHEDKN